MIGKILLGIISFIVIIGVLIGIGFGTGLLGAKYTETVGVIQNNAENKKFHNSQQYIDGAVREITDYKKQYQQAKDADEKAIIITAIQTDYANFDPMDINNIELRQWFNDAINNNLNQDGGIY
jgi:hypothetical protein